MTEDHSAKGEQLKQAQMQEQQRREAAERESSRGAGADGGSAKQDPSAEGKSSGQLEKEEMTKLAQKPH